MQRQLFLHHYFPALYFAVLCFCGVFDYVTSSLRPRTRIQIGAAILILVIWSYNYFSPLTYAKPWTRGKCERAKWLKSWDFSWWVSDALLILVQLSRAHFVAEVAVTTSTRILQVTRGIACLSPV